MCDQGQQTTPDKVARNRPPRKRERTPGEHLLPPPREGNFSLVEIGMERFSSGGAARKRPRRRKMPPLCHWRNEGFVYERLPGSPLPTVAAVLLAAPVLPSGQVLEPSLPPLAAPPELVPL